MNAKPIRVAMWSGPRNISTAMMRAWGNRPDTAVVDEPLYAYYLEKTGKDHPMAEEVVAKGETDWRKIVAGLTKEPVPDNKRIYFQKQMTHHLLPEVDREWIVDLTNCFLIRDPREVILSYIKKNPHPGLDELGFVQQCEIFEFVVGTSRCDVRGRRSAPALPPVIDARDVLQNPERTLRLLCDAIGVEFNKAMLSWPPGLRKTDGIWGAHWYDAVARSTSFEPYKAREGKIPDSLSAIHERCQECYAQLYQHRLN
jgi:hypothetical protein